MSDDPSSKDLPLEGRSAEHLPYGVETIVLRIEWPAAPASRGYNGRMWRMRPLREWTGGRADQGVPIPGLSHQKLYRRGLLARRGVVLDPS